MTYFASSTVNITGTGTGTVVSDRIIMVTVNTGATSAVLKIYDGTTVAGTLIATIDATTKGTLSYLRRLSSHNLFYALTGGNADITISFD